MSTGICTFLKSHIFFRIRVNTEALLRAVSEKMGFQWADSLLVWTGGQFTYKTQYGFKIIRIRVNGASHELCVS